MRSKNVKNAGYLLVLLPQVLFAISVLIDFPWLAVLFFFGLLPVLRLYVGNDESPANAAPSPALLFFLQCVPRIYFFSWALLLPWTIWLLGRGDFSVIDYAGIGLSFWIVVSLNTAVAHELTHTHTRLDRTLGVLLDASVGYFHFMEEHLNHHARTGHFVGGDAARPGTSVYRYAAERYSRSFADAWEFETARLKRHSQPWYHNRVVLKSAIPATIALAFYVGAGWQGVIFYMAQIVGAAFSIQAITYLQHWGLSQRFTPEVADYGFAWEDGCWMQACVTLNHAYHGQHHLNLKQPYYKLAMQKGALTLPASYPVMFVLALVPPAFDKVMGERLNRWRESVQSNEALLHDGDCVGAARVARMLRKR